MADLKPCPFCGKPGTIWESRKLVPGYHDACRTVGCKACAYTLASKYETTTWLETGGVTTNTEDVDALLASVWNTRVSPWRSLESDPPEPPTEETNHALLVRSSPLDRDLDDDRYRLLVPYQDRDNGNRWRWFESHLDYVLEDVIDGGYSEWMEVPK